MHRVKESINDKVNGSKYKLLVKPSTGYMGVIFTTSKDLNVYQNLMLLRAK